MTEVFKKCEFMGFAPSAELKAFAHVILDRIVSHSPSDATIKAHLISTPAGFKALFKLASQTAHFVAQAEAHNPVQALSELSESMAHQLQNWRLKRFEIEGKKVNGFSSATA